MYWGCDRHVGARRWSITEAPGAQLWAAKVTPRSELATGRPGAGCCFRSPPRP